MHRISLAGPSSRSLQYGRILPACPCKRFPPRVTPSISCASLKDRFKVERVKNKRKGNYFKVRFDSAEFKVPEAWVLQFAVPAGGALLMASLAAPLVVGLVISAGVVGAIMSAGALAFATLLLPLLFLSGFIMVFLFSLTLGGLGASLLLGKLVSLATTAALGLGLGWAAIKLGPPVLSRALPAAWRMRGSDSVSEEEEEPRASTRKAGRSRGQAAARGGKGSRAGDEDDDDNESGELPAAAELREFDQLLAERAKERSRKGPL